MATTVSIGEFSRMTYLSHKSLRVYHENGILPPARIDATTGYRRYTLDQIATGQIVRRLRDLDMPLADIKTFLDAADDASRNAALLTHLRRLTDQLVHTQTAVDSLQDLLLGGPGELPVDIRHLPLTAGVAVTEQVSAADLDSWWEQAYQRLDAAADRSHARRAGAIGALYHDEFFTDERGTVTAFLPLTESIAVLDAGLSTMQLPAATVAVAVHTGPFAELDRTYGALGTWVAERALGIPGPIREHYLISSRDTDRSDEHRTEVCWPLAPLDT